MSATAGTAALVRLALRRDRLIAPAWIVAAAGLVVATAAAFARLYPTSSSRFPFASAIAGNAGLRALVGPPFDLTTVGGLTAWRTCGFVATVVALMSLLTVVRHTRAEEEAGRLELLGACAVGRQAPLAAAALVTTGAGLLLAALVTAGLALQGLPLSGALALGLGCAGAGWAFAALAAVASQIVASARAARGLAGSLLALSFLARAAGDAGASWLSWSSPIGWAQQVRAFAGERWWALGLAPACAALLYGVAFFLAGRRDLGSGPFPSRAGPPSAGRRLRSPLALAWRLQRGPLLGWTAGLAIAGATGGGLARSVAELLRDSPRLRVAVSLVLGGERGLIEAFLGTFLGMVGVAASAYAVQAVSRLRSEETEGRAEPVLATAVGRTRWAASHLAFAIAGAALPLAAAGLAMGLTHGLRGGDVAAVIPRVLGVALGQLPAVWVLVGIATALFGLAPRFTAAAWAALMGFVLLEQIGTVMRLDRWILALSPFIHVPGPAASTSSTTSLLLLAGVALALVVAGLAGLRRRDLGP